MSVVQKMDYGHYFGPQHADLGSEPIPVEPYASPEYFEKEREKIFKHSWFLVGRGDEIPDVGDYFVKGISFLNSSIIIVRGKDGVVRGFHNICSHRANRVVTADNGNAKFFRCGFHGWTYDNRGKLVDMTEEDRFVGLDKATMGLTQISTETWNGFIFINPDPRPAQNLVEYLGGAGERLGGYPFDEMILAGHWETDVQCNWKVFVDAFAEIYHVTIVHSVVGPIFSGGKDQPFCRLSSFQRYGPHRSSTISVGSLNKDYVPKPMEALASKWGVGGMKQLEVTEKDVSAGDYKTYDDPDVVLDKNIIFPSTLLDIGKGYYFTYEFWPGAVDHTHWVEKIYVDKPQNAAQQLSQYNLTVQFRDGNMEDLSTMEAVQRGLMSGVKTHIHFSDQEVGCRHQYKVVDSIVRG